MAIILTQGVTVFPAIPKDLERVLPSVRSSQASIGFHSNDYLDLSRDPSVLAAFKRGIEMYGAGSTGSRLLSGNLRAHEDLETEIAEFKNFESALLFNSGYCANLGVLTAIAGPKSVIVSDKLNHASLIDGARASHATLRVFPHRDLERARELVITAQENGAEVVLVSDTVFSMDGTLADLPGLLQIQKETNCFLVLDEAHATGVLGYSGKGAFEHFHLESPRGDKILVTGTFSKALGSFGAFVCGTRKLKSFLLNKSRPFIFTTSLPGAVIEASRASLSILRGSGGELTEKLRKKSQALHSILASSFSGVSGEETNPNIPIFPVILGGSSVSSDFSKKLLEAGFSVPAIRPPTVAPGTARLRFTATLAHTHEEYAKLQEFLCGQK